jgi:Sec7-like guanine-nucleotide exchange factor
MEFVGRIDFKGLEMTEALRKFFALIKIPGTQQHHTLRG